MQQFAEADKAKITWGNIAMLNEDNVNDYGIVGAYRKMMKGSEHRASSGYTSDILRAEGRKGVKAHYKRKGELEGTKEAARKAEWMRLHPGAPEANWTRRQGVRKTRRAEHIAWRKEHKKIQQEMAAAARSSSGRSSSGRSSSGRSSSTRRSTRRSSSKRQ